MDQGTFPLEFRGAKVTIDGGMAAYPELVEALELTAEVGTLRRQPPPAVRSADSGLRFSRRLTTCLR